MMSVSAYVSLTATRALSGEPYQTFRVWLPESSEVSLPPGLPLSSRNGGKTEVSGLHHRAGEPVDLRVGDVLQERLLRDAGERIGGGRPGGHEEGGQDEQEGGERDQPAKGWPRGERAHAASLQCPRCQDAESGRASGDNWRMRLLLVDDETRLTAALRKG